MENLLAQKALLAKEKEVEALRQVSRKEKDNKIEQYLKIIKDAVIEIYATRSDGIKRMIEICEELKDSPSSQKCEQLKKEVDDFRTTLPEKNRTLLLYEKLHWNKQRVFPEATWDNEVAQEWLNYWDVPIVLGGTNEMKKWASGNPSVGDRYHQLKKEGMLCFPSDQDYKGEEVWIDIPALIMDCHMWRQRLGLEHLDAIVLHTK
jgi:hypothetical protein